MCVKSEQKAYKLKHACLIITTMAFAATNSFAAGIPTASIEEIVVTSEQQPDIQPISASEGIVMTEQLENRPASRPAELLEFTPGLIATQHSGEGKANQYFLRGFNLDHGTDFNVKVDGVPVNMRSHAHGQGYLDINFLIPELVESLAYRKGPYYAGIGDFSAAGSADFHYRDNLGSPILRLEAGEDNYYRGLAAGSLSTDRGDLLAGVSYSSYDGPWDLDQDIGKFNGLIKYNQGNNKQGFSITAMGYDNSWTAVDQIPQRAVDSGRISALGSLDTTVGGESHRYSASMDWHTVTNNDLRWQASAYAIDYRLQLYSNFTYFLDDPINGDEFEQFDNRRIYGASARLDIPLHIAGIQANIQSGLETRLDDIDTVGLYRTVARQRLSTVRDDDVAENSYSGFVQADIPWTSQFRSVLGVRVDHYTFDVSSSLVANSGNADDTIISPKASFILGPWNETEVFYNIGRGFHSNDARGTTISVDPNDSLVTADVVDPLAAALGMDFGVRTRVFEGLQLAASVWQLQLDSELIYVGDGGGTEVSGESKRYGLELGAVYTPLDWLIIDADYAWSHARLVDEPVENRIPNAVGNVVSLGMTLDNNGRWSGGLRFRHFGSAPLIEDNSRQSEPTSVFNGQVNYQLTNATKVSLAGYNLFNSSDNDITYFYESQLATEATPVADTHFHPVEPRHFRLFVSISL